MTAPYAPDLTLPRTGRWVPRGLIQVWEGPQPHPSDDLFVDEGGLVACPHCLARYDQPCRRPTGRVTGEHSERIAPRLCTCGNLPHPRRLRCVLCTTPAQREAVARNTERRRALRDQARDAA